MSHPDYDHYGGLIDLFSGKLYDGREFSIEVKTLYHSGLARFKDDPTLGRTTAGRVGPFPQGYHGLRQAGTFITELLDKGSSFENPPRDLAEPFATHASLVGPVPSSVSLISHRDRYLPGYGPGQRDVMIRVLGPVLEDLGEGTTGLRMFESESQTVNGHSVVLRLDYGNARIFLTGDLNSKSHKLLLSHLAPEEFEVGVAKGCHHGSEDVDVGFIRVMKARLTVSTFSVPLSKRRAMTST